MDKVANKNPEAQRSICHTVTTFFCILLLFWPLLPLWTALVLCVIDGLWLAWNPQVS